jgi:WD40 repeat protein
MPSTETFCPYVGLQPYTEEHRDYFFGRERDSRIISSNLYASHLTVLYGASGVGKSSILLAGVVPRLRAAARTAVVVFREWQRDDFIVALKSECVRAVELAAKKPLALNPELPLDDLLCVAAEAFGGTIHILLDQFEEYFLYHPESQAGNPFDAEFARAVNREEVDTGFLIALREDGLSKLDRFRTRIPNLLGNTLRLQHLDAAAAEDAIRKPLDVHNSRLSGANAPITIEDALVRTILDQVRSGRVSMTHAIAAGHATDRDEDARIEAPFLQLVMTRVWEEESKAGSHALRSSTLERLGGAERLVRTHLDQVMKKLRGRQRKIAAGLFHFLVTPTGAKIAHTSRDLAFYAERDEQKVRPVLDLLSSPNVRILRTVAGEPGKQTSQRYEIFHDVLGPAIFDWRQRFVERKRLWRRIRKSTLWPAGIALASLLVLVSVSILFFLEEEETKEHNLAMQKQQDRAVPYAKAILRGPINMLTTATFSPDGKYVVTAGGATSDTIANRFFFRRVEVWDTSTWEPVVKPLWARWDPSTWVLADRHDTWVTGVAFSPDGKQFVTADSDLTARLWDAGRRHALDELRGHTGAIWSVAFSPDGTKIVTASSDKTARVWNVATRKTIAELRGHNDAVRSAAFSPDGKQVVTASDDRTARLWNAVTGGSVELRGHSGPVSKAMFSPDGKWLATAAVDKTARLWEASTGRSVAVLLHPDAVSHAEFSPDGSLLVTSSTNRAYVWEVGNGNRVAELRGHLLYVYSAKFSPDGTLIVTASDDKTARVWDARTGRSVAELRGHADEVRSAMFSPDGKWVLTGSVDSTARVWDVNLTTTPSTELRAHTDVVRIAIPSRDGKWIVTAGDDNTARVWETSTGQTVAELQGHTDRVVTAAFSPDGSRVVTAGWDKTARVWDRKTGRTLVQLRGHADRISSAVFSPDGTSVVTASDDATARVWEASTGKIIAELKGHRDAVLRADFSPDGKEVVTASRDKTARVWDAVTGRSVNELRGHVADVGSAAFSPDGKKIVTASADSTARVWDAATGKIELGLPHRDLVSHAEFSPDGKLIVTASYDKTARIWAIREGAVPTVLLGHWGPVVSAKFSPDGAVVVTASHDGTARVWDAGSGQMIAELVGHAGPLVGATFSPDGKQVITASRDQTARIWDVARLRTARR